MHFMKKKCEYKIHTTCSKSCYSVWRNFMIKCEYGSYTIKANIRTKVLACIHFDEFLCVNIKLVKYLVEHAINDDFFEPQFFNQM